MTNFERTARLFRFPGLRFGIGVAIAAAVIGWTLASQQPTRWSAEVDLLVAPDVSGAGLVTSSYYDTLSNGQLPATAAAILSEGRYLREITRDNSIPDAEQVSISVTPVPETAIVRATVTAGTARVATLVARQLPSRTIPTVDRLLAPFSLTSLGHPADTVQQTSLDRWQLAVVVTIAALILGIAAQQLVFQLGRARLGAGRSASS